MMPLLAFLVVGCEAQLVYAATHLNATSLNTIIWDGQVNAFLSAPSLCSGGGDYSTLCA